MIGESRVCPKSRNVQAGTPSNLLCFCERLGGSKLTMPSQSPVTWSHSFLLLCTSWSLTQCPVGLGTQGGISYGASLRAGSKFV